MAEDSAPDKRPTHEQVYLTLREQILDGALAPGEALTIRGIAESLSVSMTPAREAARRLVAERALALTPSGRLLVPLPDRTALEELFRARALLEPELALRALPGVTNPLIRQLRAVDDTIDQAIAAGDSGAYVQANNRFHATLYAVAEAPALTALVESIWLQTAPSMRRVYGQLGTRGLMDYHEAALTALEARDAIALSNAIRADVEQGAALAAKAALDLSDL